ESKISYPGKKQIYRFSALNGEYSHDVLSLAGEDFAAAQALLEPVIENGQLVGPLPSLDQIRERSAANLARLPENFRRLEASDPYPVEKYQALKDLLETLRGRYVPLAAEAGSPAKSA
ncbi:MAG TPA: hypothetical protein VJ417_16170, partial [Candidatus Glassbacteria bacterium]|nr:hypothetical protein [Candidatus Glassbacteria bacterium]